MKKILSSIDARVSLFAQWLVRHRYSVLLFTILASLAMAYGGKNLRFTNDYRVWFSHDNPQLLAFEKMQNTYSRNDNIYIMLLPKSGKVFSKETLKAVLELTQLGWQIPYSSRVDSISNYQYTWSEEDDLIVEDLITEADNLSQNDLDRLKQIATHENLLVHRLIAEDGHATAVNITVQMPGADTTNELPVIVRAVHKLLDHMRQKYPDIQFIETGVVIMDDAFTKASISDMSTLIPAMFVTILLGIFLFTRSISGTFATMLVIVFSIISAMGLAGYSGMKLTPPTATAPLLIMTLAVADCVHFLISMLHGMRKGLSKHQAIIESLRINFMPIFLTSITTAIGFASMNFSDAPPFRDMGNVTAAGVILAFFLAIILLPTLMAILPVKENPHEDGRSYFMDKLADKVIQYHKTLLVFMTIIIVILAAFMMKNQLNDQFVEYFDKTMRFRINTDLVSKHISGLYFIDYSLDSKQAGGISDPGYLRKIERFANWLRAQPGVIYVNSYSEIMKRLNKNMHSDDERWHKLPDKRDLAAQYLLLYEMSLPYGLDLNNQINVNKSATRLSVVLRNLSSNEVIMLDKKAHAWLQQNAAGIHAESASPTLMFSHIGKRNIHSMLSGTSIAVVLISAILVFALGSKKYGLLSLAPNLVPAVMAFGLWGMLVGQVGLAVSVVASMTLGIIVDDTIHFLSKFLRARNEQNLPVRQAIRYAFHTVGMALLVTTIVLAAGFIILAQSHFIVNADMGLLTALTLVIALIVDFLFLPPLIMLIEQNKTGS